MRSKIHYLLGKRLDGMLNGDDYQKLGKGAAKEILGPEAGASVSAARYMSSKIAADPLLMITTTRLLLETPSKAQLESFQRVKDLITRPTVFCLFDPASRLGDPRGFRQVAVP